MTKKEPTHSSQSVALAASETSRETTATGTYSAEFRFSPSDVKSLPIAKLFFESLLGRITVCSIPNRPNLLLGSSCPLLVADGGAGGRPDWKCPNAPPERPTPVPVDALPVAPNPPAADRPPRLPIEVLLPPLGAPDRCSTMPSDVDDVKLKCRFSSCSCTALFSLELGPNVESAGKSSFWITNSDGDARDRASVSKSKFSEFILERMAEYRHRIPAMPTTRSLVSSGSDIFIHCA